MRPEKYPDRYAVTRGGGRALVVGLPLFAAGVGVIVGAATGVFDAGKGGAATVLPLGIVTGAFGAWLTLWRRGVVVDARARVFTRWWGLPFPFARTCVPLDGVTHVSVSQERRSEGRVHGAELKRTVYPVRLVGEGLTLDVEAPRDYDRARRLSVRLASVLGTGIQDTSSGALVARGADQFDESLRDRAARTGEPLELPPAPEVTRVRASVTPRWATFDLPAVGFGSRYAGLCLGAAVFTALPLAALWAVLAVCLPGTAPQDMVIFTVCASVIALACATVPAAFALYCVRAATGWGRLYVDADLVRREGGHLFGSEKLELLACEIGDVQVISAPDPDELTVEVSPAYPALRRRLADRRGPRLVVRSDRATVEFGRGLSLEELEWLRDTVRFIVTS